MKKIAFILALLSCSLLGLRCENDDGLFGNNGNDKNQNEEPTLPPATQSGKGTFGSKVNGEVWVPEGGSFGNPELHADYYQDEFFVGAERKVKDDDSYTGMVIRIEKDFIGEGTYKLKGNLGNDFDKYASFSNIKSNCEYETDPLNTGKLEITHFDSSKRIVSGRFHYTAVITQGNCEKDTIRVTNGRFDIQD